MKGDNIIEAYCVLCGKPITGTDARMGFHTMVEGKSIHLHHDTEIRKGMQDPKIVLAITEILQHIIDTKEDFSGKAIYDLITGKAKELNMEYSGLKRYMDGALCYAKYTPRVLKEAGIPVPELSVLVSQ